MHHRRTSRRPALIALCLAALSAGSAHALFDPNDGGTARASAVINEAQQVLAAAVMRKGVTGRVPGDVAELGLAPAIAAAWTARDGRLVRTERVTPPVCERVRAHGAGLSCDDGTVAVTP